MPSPASTAASRLASRSSGRASMRIPAACRPNRSKTRRIGAVIISEASLSLLGFGLSPEIPSWGTLLSRDGRKYTEQAPWLALWSGLCLTITVYSLNMFGDAVRDLLDPRLRGGGGRLGTHGGRTPRPGVRSQPLAPVSTRGRSRR